MANGRKCTLHSTQPGMPKTVSVACWYCGEWRCANHCRCARESIPDGRKPRRYSSAAVAAPKAKAKAAAQGVVRPRQQARVGVEAEVLRAVGRPSLPSCELVDLSQWWSKLVAEVGEASEVELATYMFDDEMLFEVLLQRLNSRRISMNLYIDTEMLAGQVPKSQRSRVSKLQEAGATVFLCKTGRSGSYHSKALVLDRRVLYTGSANFTGKSRRNRETVFRMTGPVVDQMLRQLAEDRRREPQWDGTLKQLKGFGF